MNYSTNIDYSGMIIKDIVASNFKAAHVFEKYGIDFCCKGNRMVKSACEEKGVDVTSLNNDLAGVGESAGSENLRFNDWDLNFLMQYIVNNHHSYVLSSVPKITEHLQKVVNAHGSKNPYIHEVAALFNQVADELMSHMRKEEQILFPLIKQLTDAEKSNEKPGNRAYMSVKNPISAMENEHESAGGALERIREITNNFTLPEGACPTFFLTYKELDEFEKDLHKHVFLENSILFPKAVKLEESILS